MKWNHFMTTILVYPCFKIKSWIYRDVGSTLERSFTVNVNELKPNRPNTMNLVKKWAQELGLSEVFFSNQTRPYGSGMAECMEKGWKFILGLGSRINSPSLFFSVSRQELLGVLRTAIIFLFLFLPLFFLSLSFVRSQLLYTLLLRSSWPSICWSCSSLLECLSHPAPSSTCCELQQIRWHCLGVIPSLMRPDC